eukprot:1609298-Amphidinium_carterae.1
MERASEGARALLFSFIVQCGQVTGPLPAVVDRVSLLPSPKQCSGAFLVPQVAFKSNQPPRSHREVADVKQWRGCFLSLTMSLGGFSTEKTIEGNWVESRANCPRTCCG